MTPYEPEPEGGMPEDAVMLSFDGGGSHPVQWTADFEGHEYYVRYRSGWLSVEVDDELVLEIELAPENSMDGAWTDEETNVYLFLLSESIRAGRLGDCELPTKEHVASHPYYRKGLFPQYLVCHCKLRHEHSLACYSENAVAARDLDR